MVVYIGGTLQTVAILCFFPHHVQDSVHKLSALCVVSFGPIVAGPWLAKHEIVGSEEFSASSWADCVHCTGLQIQ